MNGNDFEEGSSKVEGRSSGALRYAPIVVVLTGLSIGYAMGWTEYLSLDGLAQSRHTLRQLVADNPVGAPVGFAFVYAALVALSFPTPSLLSVFAGFMFGWLQGGLIAVLSATTGAAFLFLAARSALAPHFARRTRGLAARLSEGFRKDPFGYLLVLRIAPFIPFVAVSIAPALFNVSLRTYLAATLLGVLPGAFSYAWLGEGVDSVLTAARAAGRDVVPSDLVTREITIAFVILALVAALATVVKRVWAARDR